MSKSSQGHAVRGGSGAVRNELVVHVEEYFLRYGRRTVYLTERQPAVRLLRELIDRGNPGPLPLYRILCTKASDAVSTLDIDSQGSNYVRVLVYYLRKALKAIETPVSVDTRRCGHAARYVLNPGGVEIRCQARPKTTREESQLNVADKLYQNGAHTECIAFLEDNEALEECGMLFRSQAAVYCCLSALRLGNWEVAADYFRLILFCLLSDEERKRFDEEVTALTDND